MKPGRIHWGREFTMGESDQVGIHQGVFHVKCVCWKIFEQIGVGMAYLHVF